MREGEKIKLKSCYGKIIEVFSLKIQFNYLQNVGEGMNITFSPRERLIKPLYLSFLQIVVKRMLIYQFITT